MVDWCSGIKDTSFPSFLFWEDTHVCKRCLEGPENTDHGRRHGNRQELGHPLYREIVICGRREEVLKNTVQEWKAARGNAVPYRVRFTASRQGGRHVRRDLAGSTARWPGQPPEISLPHGTAFSARVQLGHQYRVTRDGVLFDRRRQALDRGRSQRYDPVYRYQCCVAGVGFHGSFSELFASPNSGRSVRSPDGKRRVEPVPICTTSVPDL